MRYACVLRGCLFGNWEEQDKASNDRQTDKAFFGKSRQSEFKGIRQATPKVFSLSQE